jgi:hypothetical protein
MKKKRRNTPEERRADFRNFLVDQGLDGLAVSTVLAGLEPVLQAYENKTFGTCSDDENINPDRAAEAVQLVLDNTNASIILVAVKSGEVVANGWLKEVGAENKPGWQVASILAENMGQGFGIYLERLYEEKTSKCTVRSEEIHGAMTALFGMDGMRTLDELQSAFYGGRALCRDISRNIASVVGVYVRLALIGDIEGVKDFHDLLAVMPHYLPVSELKSEPGRTWLCARFEDKPSN